MFSLTDIKDWSSQMDQWSEDLPRELDGVVTEILSRALESGYHPLVPDLEHLDAHERRSSTEFMVLGATKARLSKMVSDAKTRQKQVEGSATLRGSGDGGELQTRGIKPTGDALKAFVDQDPQVISARNYVSTVEEMEAQVTAWLRAYEKKLDLIPGMQRRRNRIFELDSRGG